MSACPNCRGSGCSVPALEFCDCPDGVSASRDFRHEINVLLRKQIAEDAPEAWALLPVDLREEITVEIFEGIQAEAARRRANPSTKGLKS